MNHRFKKIVKEVALTTVGLLMVFSAYAVAAYNDQDLYEEPNAEYPSR